MRVVTIQKTPLHDVHVSMGAKMVEFAGWSLPLSFVGIRAEHLHTRRACSVFDVSHMGRLKLTGPDAEGLLSRVCTRNLTDAEPGRSYYTHVCQEDGGVLDDLIVSRAEDHWGIICNAGNRNKIVGWLRTHATGLDVKLADETESTVMLALQGPQTIRIAQELAGVDLASLGRYRFIERKLMGASLTIYRSGYTGEDGLEVVLPRGLASMFAPMLLGTPDQPHPVIKPAGLGARDTLRIEAAMPLYGHELSEQWDSLTAGQGWCVDLSKEFIGAAAMRKLEEDGLSRRIVGLELQGRRIARQHQHVFAGGRQIGEITSGTLSPTLNKSIAMALIDSSRGELETQVEVDLGRQRIVARVVPLPFYKRPK